MKGTNPDGLQHRVSLCPWQVQGAMSALKRQIGCFKLVPNTGR